MNDTATTYTIDFHDVSVDDYGYEGATFTLLEACDVALHEGHRVWLYRHEGGVQLEGQPAVGWVDPDGNWRLL